MLKAEKSPPKQECGKIGWCCGQPENGLTLYGKFIMLRSIKKDKWKHFVVGIGLGLLFEWAAIHYLPFSIGWSSLLVFVLIVFICYGFEVASLVFKRGHYDVMDAVAGIIGGVIGMACIIFAAG